MIINIICDNKCQTCTDIHAYTDMHICIHTQINNRPLKGIGNRIILQIWFGFLWLSPLNNCLFKIISICVSKPAVRFTESMPYIYYHFACWLLDMSWWYLAKNLIQSPRVMEWIALNQSIYFMPRCPMLDNRLWKQLWGSLFIRNHRFF